MHVPINVSECTHIVKVDVILIVPGKQISMHFMFITAAIVTETFLQEY